MKCVCWIKTRCLFRSGEIVKQCAIKMAKAFGEEKVVKKF
jgi:hypothetical protein